MNYRSYLQGSESLAWRTRNAQITIITRQSTLCLNHPKQTSNCRYVHPLCLRAFSPSQGQAKGSKRPPPNDHQSWYINIPALALFRWDNFIASLFSRMGSTDPCQQHHHHSGACKKCRFSGLTPEKGLPLLCNKAPR